MLFPLFLHPFFTDISGSLHLSAMVSIHTSRGHYRFLFKWLSLHKTNDISDLCQCKPSVLRCTMAGKLGISLLTCSHLQTAAHSQEFYSIEPYRLLAAN